MQWVLGGRLGGGVPPEQTTLHSRWVISKHHMFGLLQVERIAREHDAVIPNFGLHPW